MKGDVACLGIVVADLVTKPVENLPEKGRLTLVKNIQLHTGGCATNTGFALAKLGLKVAVLGKVGKDGLGDFIFHQAQSMGVDTTGLIQDGQGNTSATIVMVSKEGERTFLHSLGANGRYALRDIDFGLIKKYQILHYAGSFLLPKLDGESIASLLKKARSSGIVTSLDTAWDATGRWLEVLEPALSHLDIFLPSIEEARMITGKKVPEEITSFLLKYGIKFIGLKMGEKGCFLQERGKGGIYIPAFPVEVRDTTGAGDAWVAGFLAGFIKGWALEKIGRFANSVGALSTFAFGATEGVRSIEESLKFAKL